MRKDGAYTKTERIARIAREIAKTMPKGILVEDILDWCEITIGLRRDTAARYIDIIVRRQGWFIEEGRIVGGSSS